MINKGKDAPEAHRFRMGSFNIMLFPGLPRQRDMKLLKNLVVDFHVLLHYGAQVLKGENHFFVMGDDQKS